MHGAADIPHHISSENFHSFPSLHISNLRLPDARFRTDGFEFGENALLKAPLLRAYLHFGKVPKVHISFQWEDCLPSVPEIQILYFSFHLSKDNLLYEPVSLFFLLLMLNNIIGLDLHIHSYASKYKEPTYEK